MTKAELIALISEQTGIERPLVSAVVESFMINVKESVAVRNESVYLRGFGSFTRKHRAAKTGRIISKNCTIDIPAHDIPYFKPSSDFVDAIEQ